MPDSAGKPGSAVTVDLGDDGDVIGIVQEDAGDTKRLVWVPVPSSDGAGQLVTVPRRDEGGGRTWRPL